MTTITGEVTPFDAMTRRRGRTLSPGTLVIAAATGLVLVEAIETLLRSHGLGATLAAGWAQLVAPGVVALVLAAVVCERLWPAVPRPLLARGHVQDGWYFAAYVIAVAPFMTLLSVGSAVVLRGHAAWLQAPWTAQWPRWAVVVATLAAMDLCNWLAHVADHRVGALWRIHALHHSQEELSVLTSFRAHPLMHTTGFVLATVPVLALTGAHPLAPVLVTVYVCLGTLPHANVGWSYGPLGRVVVSPAYHRLHHALEGRQEVNLGVVLTVWDVVAGKARFPAPGRAPCATGLAGRPVPVEQQEPARRPPHLLARQLAQPFRGA
ncbi:MAG TPA: sterol desaturase family protein [Acidimicrobiales bacterium]|nr:sterol desaturase family protein [Acidimicrobiales bacterium]